MENKEENSDRELSVRDKLLLEEYKQLLSFIIFSNNILHRVGTFYFTSIGIFFGVLFLLIREEHFTPGNTIIVIILSILALATSVFWYSNTSRTHVKLNSRMKRAKEIEKHFGEKFEACLQMLTYTGEHLKANRDCEGKPLNFLTKRTKMLSNIYPGTLVIVWEIIFIMAVYQGLGIIEIFGPS